MKLAGRIYDFGDHALSRHLHAISSELSDQAYINGEDDPGLCEDQVLYELSHLLEELAVEAARLEGALIRLTERAPRGE